MWVFHGKDAEEELGTISRCKILWIHGHLTWVHWTTLWGHWSVIISEILTFQNKRSTVYSWKPRKRVNVVFDANNPLLQTLIPFFLVSHRGISSHYLNYRLYSIYFGVKEDLGEQSSECRCTLIQPLQSWGWLGFGNNSEQANK